jgi:hypothetical protein
LSLHLVDRHRAAQLGQGSERLFQPRQADRILEIEIVGRGHGHQLAGHGGLAALTRTEQRHRRRSGKGGLQ